MMKLGMSQKGYSLIETMIAVAIFAVVLVVAVDTLLVAQTVAREISLERAAMENVALAMENMTKKIRQGYSFRCTTSNASNYAPPADCSNGNTRLSFRDQNGEYVVFRYDSANEVIQLYEDPGGFPSGVASVKYLPLTSPEVEIKSLKFYLTGASSVDSLQPLVTITMTGVARFGGGNEQQTEFFLQATVSPRLLDV